MIMSGSPEVLIVKNVTREGPGLIGEFLEEEKMGFDVMDLDRGEVWPDLEKYRILIVLGGPDSANDSTAKIVTELEKIRSWVLSGKPYLGICLGLQLLVKALGGRVERNPVKEIGFFDGDGKNYTVQVTPEGLSDGLFEGVAREFPVFQLHGETVRFEDASMTLLGEGKHCRNQVVRAGKAAYGFQCHFEVTEALLEVWSREDPDLSGISREALTGELGRQGQRQRETAALIFQNFLKHSKIKGGL